MGFLRKPVWFLTGSVALMLLVAFGLLFYSSWRHDRELEPIQRHLTHLADIQGIDDALRSLIVEYVVAYPAPIDAAKVGAINDRLIDLLTFDKSLYPETNGKITMVMQRLKLFAEGKDQAGHDNMLGLLMEALQTMRKVMLEELAAHQFLIEQKRGLAQTDKFIALGLLVGLLIISLPLAILVRRRISMPIETMEFLMSLMTQQSYVSACVDVFDPMLQPLFRNYNQMVNQLVFLEQAHQSREELLSGSVRRATRILIQQQRRVAQAERLGAVGEIAASVAHELRNPLTAIHMTLQNLRQEIEVPEHVDRIDLVINEIKRMNRQLNLLLDSAKQVPEPLVLVNVAALLKEICTLILYQVSEEITITIDAPDDLVCSLPEMQFHQCIFNLFINACQLLGEGPGLIQIEAGLAGNQLRLVIEDDGPGFPHQVLETGVRPFDSWRKGGTGLGLVMVRRFVGDLGGTLRLENQEPHGARIVMTLPCLVDNS
jgi:two-component system NtrC family sensor kinase